jgi:AraC-like DNA-binding protein
MKDSDIYAAAARELTRAVRGKRSQVVLSRRLGYRGNPITDWEAGRSYPDVLEVLKAARLARLPVKAAFERFHAAPAPQPEDGARGLAAWLDSMRGATTLATLAERMGCSRYTVRRWFSAETQVKLPAFLQLIDIMAGRAQDWVAELVEIEQVPALRERFARVNLAKQLAFELPWSEAILRVLETTTYQRHPAAGAAFVSEWLGLEIEEVQHALTQMAAAGVIRDTGNAYTVVGTISVDTRARPDGLRQLRQHWLSALAQRSGSAHPEDWGGYNVISVSAADLAWIKERLQSLYRELRARVAASEPPEEVALVLLQLTHWATPRHLSTAGAHERS